MGDKSKKSDCRHEIILNGSCSSCGKNMEQDILESAIKSITEWQPEPRCREVSAIQFLERVWRRLGWQVRVETAIVTDADGFSRSGWMVTAHGGTRHFDAPEAKSEENVPAVVQGKPCRYLWEAVRSLKNAMMAAGVIKGRKMTKEEWDQERTVCEL